MARGNLEQLWGIFEQLFIQRTIESNLYGLRIIFTLTLVPLEAIMKVI